LTTFICLSKQKSYPWNDGYWRTGSVRLNRRVSPSDAAIRRWFSQWHVKGNVENKSPIGRLRKNCAGVRRDQQRNMP
ncbi:hypothetical protein C0J52_02731, partial [Blattella germanica]